MEKYRVFAREKLLIWHDTVNSKNQEWLIVYLENNERSVGTNKQSGMKNPFKSTVLDKIRQDFNKNRRDRVIRINVNDLDIPVNNASQASSLISKIITGVFFSFDSMVAEYIHEIERLDALKALPGFNYFNYFMLKKRLATEHESLGLYGEALIQYDDLDVVFHERMEHIFQRDVIPWSKNFGAKGEFDDSSDDIFGEQKKDYYSLIADNSISLFDFQNYLISCQLKVLSKMNRPLEICVRTTEFVSAMSSSLLARKKDLVPFFVESWVFSVCLAVVNHCDETFASFPDPILFFRFRGELLNDAKKQLDKLGKEFGFLKAVPAHLFDPKADIKRKELHITNSDLREALKSIESFDALYRDITSKAWESFKVSGNPRKFRLLFSDLLNLDFYRGEWEEAYTSYKKFLEWDYIFRYLKDHDAFAQNSRSQDNREMVALEVLLVEIDSWTPFEVEILTRMIRCCTELQKNDNSVADIAFQACLLLIVHRHLINFQDYKSTMEFYFEKLLLLDSIVQGPYIYQINVGNLFDISIQQFYGDSFINSDGRTIKAEIMSRLPAELAIKGYSINMISENGYYGSTSIKFSLSNPIEALKPGLNTIYLHCSPHAQPGTYRPIGFSIECKNFVMRKNYTYEKTEKFYVRNLNCTPQFSFSFPRVTELSYDGMKMRLNITMTLKTQNSKINEETILRFSHKKDSLVLGLNQEYDELCANRRKDKLIIENEFIIRKSLPEAVTKTFEFVLTMHNSTKNKDGLILKLSLVSKASKSTELPFESDVYIPTHHFCRIVHRQDELQLTCTDVVKINNVSPTPWMMDISKEQFDKLGLNNEPILVKNSTGNFEDLEIEFDDTTLDIIRQIRENVEQLLTKRKINLDEDENYASFITFFLFLYSFPTVKVLNSAKRKIIDTGQTRIIPGSPWTSPKPSFFTLQTLMTELDARKSWNTLINLVSSMIFKGELKTKVQEILSVKDRELISCICDLIHDYWTDESRSTITRRESNSLKLLIKFSK